MKILPNQFLYFIVLFSFSSCIFYPQVTDIPLIKEKNDLSVDGGISISARTVNSTISYGLSEKMAVQVFGSYGADEAYYLQGAFGHFKNLGNSSIIEIYAGYGYGYGSAQKETNIGHLNGNYQLYFTQLNMGKRNYRGSNVDFGMGVKTGIYNSNLTDENYFYSYPRSNFFETQQFKSILLEPNLFVRFGGEILRFNLKVGSSFVKQLSNKNHHIPSSSLNVGLSLNYRINTKNKIE